MWLQVSLLSDLQAAVIIARMAEWNTRSQTRKGQQHEALHGCHEMFGRSTGIVYRERVQQELHRSHMTLYGHLLVIPIAAFIILNQLNVTG